MHKVSPDETATFLGISPTGTGRFSFISADILPLIKLAEYVMGD
jgi:hypothetical protein